MTMTPPLTNTPRLVDQLRDAKLPSPRRRREIRAAAGATVEQVAQELGVSAFAVRTWETGTRKPWPRHAAAYRRLLDALEDLAREELNPTAPET